jgi:outer membrane protein
MNLSQRRSVLILNLCICALGLTAEAAGQNGGGRDAQETASVVTRSLFPTASPSGAYSPGNLNRVGVQTGDTLPLSLQDAIRRTLEGNNSIEVSRGDVRFQETQYRSLLGIYDPVFRAQPTFSRSSTTGNSPTRDFSVNTDLSQFIGPGGGNYQVFFNNRRTENAFAQAQVTSGSVTGGNGALFSSSLGVNYTQPLARNFRVDSKRHQITIAKKRLEQTDADFRTLVTATVTQVQTAYWDFVFALRNQQNQVANVDLAKENLRQIEARIQAGAAAPLERAEVATELANREGELLLATQQVSIAENTLKGLVLRDPLSDEWSRTFVPTDPPAFSLDPVNLDAALKDAMDNRFELRSLKIQQESNQADLKFYNNQKKPQIDLNTTFALDGLSRGGANSAINTTLLTNSQDIFLFNSLNSTRAALGLPLLVNPPVVIPASPAFLFGGFNRSLANIFRSDAPNFSVGVTFSFPLRNRTAKANYDGAKVQEQQLDARVRGQEQTVVIDVRNAVQAVETTRQRVLTARRALENAEIQLEGERKLYEAGKSTTFLLFQRENTLTNAKNAEIRAETDYNKALADLQRATATAFRANNITVESPVPGLH